MQVDQAVYERQADAETAPRAIQGRLALAEHVEDRRQQLWRDAESGVFDAEDGIVAVAAHRHANPAAGRRILDRVRHDVREHLFEPDSVALDGHGLGAHLDAAIERRVSHEGGDGVTNRLRHVERVAITVRLPRVANAAKPPAVASPLHGTMARRVLLIEDSRDARDMFRMLLERAGHSVCEAENGYRGLELLDREHPDVAIIDIGLPGLDGYQVARRIRAHPHGRAMVLLALTGYGSLRDHEHSVEAGFDHHLVKPVDVEKLERLLGEGVACSETHA